ncbi:uncharacterized protein LOC116206935 [Punica granatum]|uniref:Uncharacterized protein n=2 Tax=Punica granatum TaxID=22663 RepID=A0A218XC02_PUNGR|nr:uncharacterized protein LOC116206935 [Punica granatum]OWM82250.1 hypothetical protein CDL15_Pgr001824 [Punica granatum]PKI76341.1 hypothetical protein CRG98_003263 [Punica granatum]
MADIAMLVAEEYERRIKINSSCCSVNKTHQDQAHQHGGGGLKLINMGLVSRYVSDLGEMKQRLEGVGKWVLALQEPRSPFGIAASHGFFSA